jgi:hypothetical protein
VLFTAVVLFVVGLSVLVVGRVIVVADLVGVPAGFFSLAAVLVVAVLLVDGSFGIDIVDALFFIVLEASCFVGTPNAGLFEGFSTTATGDGSGMASGFLVMTGA